jgi:hypothetical protein
MPAHRPPLSRRLPWDQACNALAAEVADRKARGLTTIDLTESNPTRVGLAYPEAELAEILRRSAAATHRILSASPKRARPSPPPCPAPATRSRRTTWC